MIHIFASVMNTAESCDQSHYGWHNDDYRRLSMRTNLKTCHANQPEWQENVVAINVICPEYYFASVPETPQNK